MNPGRPSYRAGRCGARRHVGRGEPGEQAMKAGALLPNRLHAPLTDDERLAEQYLDRPARLLELAQETRNRALYWIARELLRRPKKRERRGYEDRH